MTRNVHLCNDKGVRPLDVADDGVPAIRVAVPPRRGRVI